MYNNYPSIVPFLYSDHRLLLSASTFADCCHFLNVTIEDANVVPVIMNWWPTQILIHDVTTKYPKPADPRRLLICNLFSWNRSHSDNNLRRDSTSPLLHPFTRRRSGTLDWRVTRATSADSSRLIHTILAHSSTLLYLSIFCHHRTLVLQKRKTSFWRDTTIVYLDTFW
jgi:hypothetical protein